LPVIAKGRETTPKAHNAPKRFGRGLGFHIRRIEVVLVRLVQVCRQWRAGGVERPGSRKRRPVIRRVRPPDVVIVGRVPADRIAHRSQTRFLDRGLLVLTDCPQEDEPLLPQRNLERRLTIIEVLPRFRNPAFRATGGKNPLGRHGRV
jgi:hypothetical protein